ncbi:MAG: hypothetical protein HYX75_10435 [Acidobacteria bacterium]|nr:hypothetical protein [Acidobacteriota bacterium]
MREKVRGCRWGLGLVVLCALIAPFGCDRPGRESKTSPAGSGEKAQTMIVPPPPGQPQPPPPPGQESPIEAYLFPPDLIMVHQTEIGIRDEQREDIIKAVQEAQSKIMRLQWEMHQATALLESLLAGSRVDAAKTLDTSKRITEIEGEIKRIHLAMLIGIKNQLSEEQQHQLSELRRGRAPQGR